MLIGSSTGNPQGALITSSNASITITPGNGSLDITTTSGSGVTSVSGTADRITSSGGTTPTIDIAATYVGQNSITTLGTIATGTWNGTEIAVANGGTGATDASTARTNLGLAIGTNVQAYDAGLSDIAGLAVTDGNIIVGDGLNWVAESGSTARTSLGLGSISTQDSNNVTITGGSITGITDLAVADGGTGASTLTGVLTGNGTSAITASAVTQYGVLIGGASNAVDSTAVGTAGDVLTSNGPGLAPTYQTPTVGTVTSVSGTLNRITSTGGATPVIDIDAAYVGQTSLTTLGTVTTGTWSATDIAVTDGGTGASDAATARTNLGLAIGTNVQAWDAQLDDIAGLAVTDGNFIVGDGLNWVAESGATARTSLGLGSIATQDSNNVTITGGSITGITDLVVADGGTGVSSNTAYAVLCGGTTATGAIQSIASVGTSGQVLTSNGAGALPTFQDAAAGGGAWTFISSASASASSAITFTGLSSSYYVYKIVIVNCRPTTDGDHFYLRTSTNNGSSYDSGVSDYNWSNYFNKTTTPTSDGDIADSEIEFFSDGANGDLGNLSTENFNLDIDLFFPASASAYKMCSWKGGYWQNTAECQQIIGSGSRLSTTAVNAIQFTMSTGTIAQGTFKLYGLALS